MVREEQLQPKKMQLKKLLVRGSKYNWVLPLKSIVYILMDSKKILLLGLNEILGKCDFL